MFGWHSLNVGRCCRHCLAAGSCGEAQGRGHEGPDFIGEIEWIGSLFARQGPDQGLADSTDHQRDQQLIDELRNNPKEQAEHIMLLDLERNDLGRICQAGTVQVDEFMTVETYAHVHHIVSNVHGTLRNDIIPGQAIAAVFPGGTITGCPKVRCMQVIAELEKVPRGAYTGSMGYLNRDGSMDLNILIRSLHQRGNQLQFRAGAGIVADSIPERELDETRAKALGMLRALGTSMSTNK